MNKKRILYIASTEIHLLSFHLPYLKWFKSQGFEVHVAYNGKNKIPFADINWDIPFGRSPFEKTNLKAYKQLKKIINENYYELIHCHTPMASIITRLSSIKSRKKNATKVLYTAHGFHFFKGSPIKNWLIYYPIEILMSVLTDAIITINSEDYKNLLDNKFRSKGKYLINGIGINPERLELKNYDVEKVRKNLNLTPKDFIILYIAEFVERKNHKFIIYSLSKYLTSHPDIKIIFAGGGELINDMKKLVNKLKLNKSIIFIGFVKDIGKYISIADIGISASKQEGMPIGISELIFYEKPVVVSDERGHRELIVENENGFIYEQNNNEKFVSYIHKLYSNKELYDEISKNSKRTIEKFMINTSLKQMIDIYKTNMN